MSLFQSGNFTLHSGQQSDFKIDCDTLTDEDWETLAAIIAKRREFREVIGVPQGGIPLARALEKYAQPSMIGRYGLPILIVDDVLTTGASMEEVRLKRRDTQVDRFIGVVVFARGSCPNWITPIFQMWG